MKARLMVLALFVLAIRVPAAAQFTGFSAPLGISVTPFNAAACTGAPQTAIIANLAQTEHYATLTTTGPVVAIRATIQGSHDGVLFNDISDVATASGNIVMGQGYYPITQISVTCAAAAGNFTVRYSGEATAPAPQIAALQSAQIDKSIANGAPSNANFTSQILRTPFGNTGGALFFTYSGAGPAGSVLNILCGSILITPSFSVASYPLGTTASTQYFPVSLLPCDFMTVTYTSGGASATSFQLSYVFNSVNVTGGDPCQGATAPKLSAAINASAATQKLVADLAGHAVFLCGFNFTLTSGGAAATAQFVSGTGAACAGGAVNLTGTQTGVASSSIAISSGGGGYVLAKTVLGAGLCLVAVGAGSSAQGLLTYVQQ